MITEKKRDIGIDILKFLAVLLVVNSHLDCCFPGKFSVLATGGAFGDCLFFFCSGYTLFMGEIGSFVEWYKRRVYRILPSVLVFALIASTFMQKSWLNIFTGYWFVNCILIYYVVFYLIRRYLSEFLPVVAVAVLLVLGFLYYFLVLDYTHPIYGGGFFMWCHYFIPMFVGAVCGKMRERFRFSKMLMGWGLVVSCILWMVMSKLPLCYSGWEWMQVWSLIPLTFVPIGLYGIASSASLVRIFEVNHIVRAVVMFVGGLCLEVYLSHMLVVTDKMNWIFPLNILIIFVFIIPVAYALRCVTRLFVQTLNGQSSYNWYAIVKPY